MLYIRYFDFINFFMNRHLYTGSQNTARNVSKQGAVEKSLDKVMVREKVFLGVPLTQSPCASAASFYYYFLHLYVY